LTLANLPIRIMAFRIATIPAQATRTIPPILRVIHMTLPVAQAIPIQAVQVILAPRIPAVVTPVAADIEQQHGRPALATGVQRKSCYLALI
jgi:hypothetical protein